MWTCMEHTHAMSPVYPILPHTPCHTQTTQRNRRRATPVRATASSACPLPCIHPFITKLPLHSSLDPDPQMCGTHRPPCPPTMKKATPLLPLSHSPARHFLCPRPGPNCDDTPGRNYFTCPPTGAKLFTCPTHPITQQVRGAGQHPGAVRHQPLRRHRGPGLSGKAKKK